MKKLLLAILVIASITQVSCNKNEISTPENVTTTKKTRQQQEAFETFYCKMDDGTKGAQCKTGIKCICFKATECCSQETQLIHYNDKLHELYTEVEISNLVPGTIITNLELINALKEDGFPIN